MLTDGTDILGEIGLVDRIVDNLSGVTPNVAQGNF